MQQHLDRHYKNTQTYLYLIEQDDINEVSLKKYFITV